MYFVVEVLYIVCIVYSAAIQVLHTHFIARGVQSQKTMYEVQTSEAHRVWGQFGGHSTQALITTCRNRVDSSHRGWHRWQRASGWDGSSLERRACRRSRFHFDFICIGDRSSSLFTSIFSIAPTRTCEGGVGTGHWQLHG